MIYLATFLFSGMFLISTSAAQTARIMPLGNSITEGTGSTGDNTGYRKPLWQMLNPSYSIDFVGSLYGGDGTFDGNHEGHAGWDSQQIRVNLNSWISQASPDFVLFHIGTNDISEFRSTQAIINDINACLDIIWNHNGSTRVFLCAIIPRRDNLNPQTQQLNTAIANLVASRQNSRPINLVDQYSAFTQYSNWSTALMYNDLHPNNSGYQVMAQKFYDAILPYLQPVTPVELVSFNATPNSDGVSLGWTTATESNNLGFYIQHSFENGEFEEIGFVAGHGTTSIPQAYHFEHDTRRSGRHRYRLRQVDTDGSFEYSKAVEIMLAPPASIALYDNYPNPFVAGPGGSGLTHIKFDLPADAPVTVSIFDIRGREIARLTDGWRSAGSHVLTWDGRTALGQLAASGTYFIRMHTDGQSAVKRLQLVR